MFLTLHAGFTAGVSGGISLMNSINAVADKRQADAIKAAEENNGKAVEAAERNLTDAKKAADQGVPASKVGYLAQVNLGYYHCFGSGWGLHTELSGGWNFKTSGKVGENFYNQTWMASLALKPAYFFTNMVGAHLTVGAGLTGVNVRKTEGDLGKDAEEVRGNIMPVNVFAGLGFIFKPADYVAVTLEGTVDVWSSSGKVGTAKSDNEGKVTYTAAAADATAYKLQAWNTKVLLGVKYWS